MSRREARLLETLAMFLKNLWFPNFLVRHYKRDLRAPNIVGTALVDPECAETLDLDERLKLEKVIVQDARLAAQPHRRRWKGQSVAELVDHSTAPLLSR